MAGAAVKLCRYVMEPALSGPCTDGKLTPQVVGMVTGRQESLR